MKRIILNFLALLTLTFMPATMLMGTAAAATGCPSDTSSGGQVLHGIGETGNNCNDSSFTDAIAAGVRILSYVVGVLAVIMVIIAGYKYITSAGDAAKISSAKNTLIYAMVGLGIAALAQVIVQFVLSSTIHPK